MLSRSLKLSGSLPLGTSGAPMWSSLFGSGLRYQRPYCKYILVCLALRIVIVIRVSSKKEDDKPFKVPIAEDSYETYHLNPPEFSLQTTKNQLRNLYHDMTVIRLDVNFSIWMGSEIANAWQADGTRGRRFVQRQKDQRLLPFVNRTRSSCSWD